MVWAALVIACTRCSHSAVGHEADGSTDPDAAADVTTEASSPPDPCRVAAEHDLTYCNWDLGGMHYCEAAPESGVCAELSVPPQWAAEVLLEGCVGKCVVEVEKIDPVVDGSCCNTVYAITVWL